MILDSSCLSTEGGKALSAGAYSPFWEVGKTLNHLHHLQMKAWLCSDSSAAEDATCCWDQLLLHAEETQLSIQLQDWFRSRIQAARYQWDQMFNSEWRAESIYKANRRIEDRFCSEGRPDDRIRAEEWKDLLFTPNQLVREERLAWEATFAACELGIFRLALLVSQIIHPIDVSQILWQMPDAPLMIAHRDESEPSLITSTNCRFSHEKDWHFPIGINQNQPVTPSATWWWELHRRWGKAGLPQTHCPNESDFNFPVSANDILNALDERFLSDSSGWAKIDTTTQPDSQEQAGSANPLEFEFDSKHHVIRREDKVVRARPLIIKLVQFLSERTTTLSDFEVLKENWEAFGGSDDPSRGTVDKTLSEMKTALKELNVSVPNKLGRGWRLADKSVAAESD